MRTVWQAEAERHYAATGLFVAGFVTTGHPLYPMADGSDVTADVTAAVVGVRDPAAQPDDPARRYGRWSRL